MKRVGITGQHGFLGQHLFNTLKLSLENFELIDFKKEYFGDESNLDSFVAKCNTLRDVVVYFFEGNLLVKLQIGTKGGSSNIFKLFLIDV